MAVNVLIVEGQEPFRMAARMVVDATDGFEVVGESETGEDSVLKAKELDPDLVLMDGNLPGVNGLVAPPTATLGCLTPAFPASFPALSKESDRSSRRRRSSRGFPGGETSSCSAA